MTDRNTVTITREVTLEELLSANVTMVDDDGDGDSRWTESMGELVARELVAQCGVRDMRTQIWKAVNTEVNRLILEAVAAKPTADGTLASMITAEVIGQLNPNPHSYQGTATPLKQWLSGEIYRQLREPALAAIDKAVAEVTKLVDEQMTRWIAERAGRSA